MLQIFESSQYHDLETDNPRLLPLGWIELTTLLANLDAPKKNPDGGVLQPLVCSDTCEQEFLIYKWVAVRSRDACGQGVQQAY